MAVQNNNPPEQTKAWRLLAEHQRQVAQLHLREEFTRDPGRAQRFSLGLERVFIDFSKNLITAETLSLLLDLAGQRGLDKKIDELFSGHEVNTTERRPALHTLLRAPENRGQTTFSPFSQEEREKKRGLTPVSEEREKKRGLTPISRMFDFVGRVRAGQVEGSTGKPITRVVNIGIGGSDLGPRLLVEALSEFHQDGIDIDFAANIDPV